MSQLDLALTASISSRHLSFLESGRAQPSREMVLTLGDAMDVPLREQNRLLRAAGFVEIYRETALEAPELSGVKQALEFLIARHDITSAGYGWTRPGPCDWPTRRPRA